MQRHTEVNDFAVTEEIKLLLNSTDMFTTPTFKTGTILDMFDHEHIIKVFVLEDSLGGITVMDAQGFLHEAEVWRKRIEDGSYVLRSKVPGRIKKSQGYNKQKEVKEPAWELFRFERLAA